MVMRVPIKGFYWTDVAHWIAGWLPAYTMEEAAVCLNTLSLLWMFTTTVQGLEIQLSNASVDLARDRSCCGRSAHALNGQYPNLQCKCDSFCIIYGDCCLDYALYFPDAEAEATVSEALVNCSGAGRSGNSTVNDSLASEGVTGDSCLVWESDVGGPGMDKAVRGYLCQLRALWAPVILKRSTTRRFVPAPGQQRYQLLQDCGRDASVEDIEACELERPFGSINYLHDVISLLPVTAGDGLHYKNMHCAHCHGFKSIDVVFWTIELFCRPPDLDIGVIFSTDISLVATNCSIYEVNIPREFPWKISETRFVPKAMFQCDDSPENADNAAACHAYSSPFDDYPNPHCAMCAIIATPETNTTFPNNPHEPCLQACGPRPISVLFDFSPGQGTSLSLRGQSPEFIVPNCEHGHVFDVSTGRCRVFYCPSGQTVADDGFTCVSLGNQANQCMNRSEITDDSAFFSCDMLLQIKSSQYDPSWIFVVDHIQQLLGVEIEAFELKEESSNQIGSYDCPFVAPYSYKMVFTCYRSNTTIEAFAQFIADTVANRCWNISNPELALSILDVRIRNFEKGLLRDECAKRGQVIIHYRSGSVSRLTIGEDPYIRILIDNETVVCSSFETYQEVYLTPGRDSGTAWSVFSCRAKLRCPIIILNSSEFAWITYNGTEFAIHRDNGQNFSADDLIEMTGGDIAVCRFASAENATNDNPSVEAETIVSLVGITVSQMFLLLSLLNYYMFSELRKLPGKNMISFILALFSMQLIFLLGLGSPLYRYTLTTEASCLTFAVLTHYLMMAVFFWSNVISLHFVRTFGGRLRLMRPAESRMGHRAFLLYSLYGWGVPAVLVGVSCAVHFLAEINGQRQNVYGDICIISGGIVLLFALPVCCLMCLNAVFFVCTVVGIRRTRNDASFAQRERGRLETIQMELSLCFKIFVATGIMWFILFILGFFEVQGISYLVSIDFTLQGPLVFFAFAFTKRVRDLWRKKLSSTTKRSRKTCTGRTTGDGDTAISTDGLSGGNGNGNEGLGIYFTQTEHFSRSGCTFTNPLYDEFDASANNDCNDSHANVDV